MSVNGVSEIKKELRQRFRNIRLSISEGEKSELDRSVAENFLALAQYGEAEVLLVYISKDIEVGTELIIDQALRDGKKVAAPKCDIKTNEMEFYIISSRDDLAEGYYGLMEPDPDKCPEVEDFSGALCIVPALAYDRKGFRLGFGKGYYDRFLARFGGVSAGLCYESCVCGELPRGEFDRRVNILVTEKRTVSV